MFTLINISTVYTTHLLVVILLKHLEHAPQGYVHCMMYNVHTYTI